MPNKREEPELTIRDHRRFTAEGESLTEAPPDGMSPEPIPSPPLADFREPVQPHPQPSGGAPTEQEQRPSASAEQRAASDQAYRQSNDAMDAQLRQELGGQAVAEEFKTGFERILEPFYVTALMQLGFMGQENATQRRVDIIGARQSIDSVILLQQKTAGNLTPQETAILEDVLYDLRMKYLEITNAVARAVQNPPAGSPGGAGSRPPKP
ncbi:MAG: DUF1844 domain-containing protein [Terriglobales bacterium]